MHIRDANPSLDLKIYIDSGPMRELPGVSGFPLRFARILCIMHFGLVYLSVT